MGFIKKFILSLGVIFSLFGGMVSVGQAQNFRIATLSPGGSLWMESFKKAAAQIKEKTQGRVSFRFYPGGVMGSEQVALRKMQIGQLQGAAVSTGALYGRYPALSLYSMPFMFSSQPHVDFVRTQLDAPLKTGALEKGYVVAGLIGGGFAYLMSQHPVKKFSDLKARKIWVPETDQQSAETLRHLGLNPIPLSLGDVLMGLETGLIDTIAAPPVVAIALQWHTRVSHVVKLPLLPIHGAVVLGQKPFEKASPADRHLILDIFGKTAEKLQGQNNEDNAAALKALKTQGIEVFEPKGADLESWHGIEAKVRQNVIEVSAISAPLLARVQQLADQYTQNAKQVHAEGAP